MTNPLTTQSYGHPHHAIITLDVAEPILLQAVRTIAKSTQCDPVALSCLLNVLPRSTLPSLTYSVLVFLPHINMDTATKRGDLDMLERMVHWSKRPRGRPVHYTASAVIEAALAAGHTSIAEWWLAKSGLCVQYSAMSVLKSRCQLDVLDWWKQQRFQGLQIEPDGIVPFLVQASQDGRVEALDWWLKNVSAADLSKCHHFSGFAWPFHQRFGNNDLSQLDVMGGAARHGHLAVLDWWWSNAQAGLAMWPCLVTIVQNAFLGNRVAVLEWCQVHPAVIQAHNTHPPDWQRMIVPHVKHGCPSLEWIDRLGISLAGLPHCPRSVVYLGLGSMRWLHSRFTITRGQLEMLCAAVDVPAVKLEVLDWIHANLEPDHRSELTKSLDPFVSPIKSGRLDILDWLLQNRYVFASRGVAPYFTAASQHTNTESLEWLVETAAELGYAIDFAQVVSPSALKSATDNGCVAILEWWLTRLSAIHPFPFKPERDPSLLVDACRQGYVEVIDWWLTKSGPLKDWLTIESIYVRICNRYSHARVRDSVNYGRQLDVLNLWWQAGYPIEDHVACVYAACITKSIDILDWLLHVAKVPQSAFVEAFTNVDTASRRLFKGLNPRPKTPLRSAIWWWANAIAMPGAQGMAIHTQLARDPIVAFVLKDVIQVPEVKVLCPVSASREGNTALLQYLVQTGQHA